MSFGSPMDKSKVIGLVVDEQGNPAPWHDMLELNRMAFDDVLPRNSESRAISVALKLIKKNAPNIKWILSFADGTQCGDGTIYRASGFALTQVRPNKTIYLTDSGEKVSRLTVTAHRPQDVAKLKEWELLDGYMMRYIKVLDPQYHIAETIPYSAIKEAGAGMYKGEKR